MAASGQAAKDENPRHLPWLTPLTSKRLKDSPNGTDSRSSNGPKTAKVCWRAERAGKEEEQIRKICGDCTSTKA
jgi:hypothetical protein